MSASASLSYSSLSTPISSSNSHHPRYAAPTSISTNTALVPQEITYPFALTDPILSTAKLQQKCLMFRDRDDFIYTIEDDTLTVVCTLHYALQFYALRSRVIGNRKFIQSMLQCKPMHAKGGKSGAEFFKTMDEQFIMKKIGTKEMKQVLGTAAEYFEHYSETYFDGEPSLLMPFFGIVTIDRRASAALGRKSMQHFVIMQNLFYDKEITQAFDLKGSVRSRYVKDGGGEGSVLLDSNYIERMFSQKLALEDRNWNKMIVSVERDAHFLESIKVVDYSLLVGVDSHTNTLCCGIIDYIRQFDFEKQLESMVKKSGILGQGSVAPTIVKPSEYCERFLISVRNYFTSIPSKFASVVLPNF